MKIEILLVTVNILHKEFYSRKGMKNTQRTDGYLRDLRRQTKWKDEVAVRTDN
jgi:hypothetical protein